MPESKTPKAARHLPFFILGVATLCLAGCREKSFTIDRDADSPGLSVVVDSMSKTIDPDALAQMRWQDIAPTVESCVRYRLTEQTLKVSESLDFPPVAYLRGLLKFSLGDPVGASEEWAKIDLTAIPSDHLYAPWRLARSANSVENRYEAPLAKAVAENQASPLIRARFHGNHGMWRDSLDAYLLSDPATWSTHEVKIFSALKLQAPCTRDVEVLMAGALAGGRVPESLRAELARLIKGMPLPDKELLAAHLENNPSFAKAAVDAAARALALRQAFASNRFREVLEKVRSEDPLRATDETVLLAFLSAARLKELTTTELWSGELLRRNPNEQTRKWIATIQAEAR